MFQKFSKLFSEMYHAISRSSFISKRNALFKCWTTTFSTKATLRTEPFKLFKLKDGPSSKTTIEKNEAIKIYKNMMIIRLMEKVCSQMYRDKLIRGFLHLYSGQEAIAVGMLSVMEKEDRVITAYRCHGWAYLTGITLAEIFSELTGRVTGISRGKGGSMHLYGPKFYGGNGIVGAQVPLGTGVALALKYKGMKNICITLYGDGASNQGQVFESYNIAKLQKLPCIFVCENNEYGMGTIAHRSSGNTKYYTRGDYIPGIWVDGMDVCSTREVIRFAKKWCASGKGPLVIEAHTYRYFGHSMSDPGTSYRSREEVNRTRKKRDPIKKFKKKILDAKLVTESELKKIDKEAATVIDQAKQKSIKDKYPPLKELPADIYTKNLEKKVRSPILWEPLEAINIRKTSS